MLVVGLVEGLLSVDWVGADQPSVSRVLGDVRRVRCWLDSVEVAAARRLGELAEVSPSLFPEHIAAQAGRITLHEAVKGFDRARTTAAMPEMGNALTEGQTSGGHVDVVTRALRELTPPQRDQLASRGDVIAIASTLLPRDEFARTVRGEVRRIRTDDGVERLQQQRRNTSLRTWTDKDTGMWCMGGEFDPETGALLAGRLHNAVEMLFHDHQPESCPADPLLKQHHLRALAMDALTKGALRNGSDSRSSARIDMSVLIDADTLLNGEHAGSIVDIGLDVELPIDTLRRWACLADITPIIVGADGVSLYLGRERRTANRAQRRALRAMYRCCGIPGCTVGFDNCEIHHVRWFRNLGPSDIDKFVLC